MITKIVLTNFMSHAHTVIEPAAGLTVLVGPNNVGKSAVVVALEILRRNDKSEFAVRHGAKQASVVVETDDGHQIEWRRKSAPSYVIDDQVFDRLGKGGVPDELHQALRLPVVDSGVDAEFDIHFGTQKSPIFLLDATPSQRARFFASSSDANDLMEIQKRHKDKLAESQREKLRLDEESRELNAQLELLEPVVDLDRRLEQVEEAHDELQDLQRQLGQGAGHVRELRDQLAFMTVQQQLAQAMARLASPPAMAPTAALENLITALARAQAQQQSSEARVQALAALMAPPSLSPSTPLERLASELAASAAQTEYHAAVRHSVSQLVSPPDLESEAPLRALVGFLSVARQEFERWSLVQQATNSLDEPKMPQDTLPIAELAERMRASAEAVAIRERELRAAESAVAEAAEELISKARGGNCSVCGSPLDPDRVLAQAAAGLGGHAHG